MDVHRKAGCSMRILIVGAGIAGPTLAYWLQRTGHRVTLVEHASEPRAGGYVVDFWGAGFEVASRMGIRPRLLNQGYRVRELREVSRSGGRIARLDPLRLIDRAGGRYVSIARSDLAHAVLDACAGDVEIIFGDTVSSLNDDGQCVQVVFRSGAEREFDLVVGADGLHSRVRALAFGPEESFQRDLGIAVAVFDVAGYQPREELVAIMHTEVGAQALKFALHDGATMFCFMFRYGGALPTEDVVAQQDLLRARLAGMGWETPEILSTMGRARTFYFDSAAQIRMPSWSSGRVALVGDAGAAPSLLAGEGSGLAMVSAYLLAQALAGEGDHRAALASWQGEFAPAVRKKQDAAIGLGAAFAPRNRAQLWLRNGLLGLMGVPVVADLVMGRSLEDPIRLPPATGE